MTGRQAQTGSLPASMKAPNKLRRPASDKWETKTRFKRDQSVLGEVKGRVND